MTDPTLPSIGGASRELRRLSDWLSPLQTVLLHRGYRRSYIGGSSAREILDGIFLGVELSPRDVDLYVVKHDTVRVSDLDELCDDIRMRDLAEIGPLREKRRANPALPGDACYRYLAGFGVHLFSTGRPIISLGILHQDSDLALNGLFDIDTIFLVVDNDKPFLRYVERVCDRPDSPDLVVDPHDGYRAWRRRAPEIVHWAEVERGLPRSAFRLVRGLAKASRLQLPEPLYAELRRRRPAGGVLDDPAELYRDFLKVLGDAHWAEELDMLARMGALAALSVSLQAGIAATTPGRLRRVLPAHQGASAYELSCRRAAALCGDPALLADVLSVGPLVYGAR